MKKVSATVTILLLLFGTTSIVQALVIRSGSINWSYDAPTVAYMDFRVGHVIDFAQNFFTKTRWNRTFKLIRGYPLGN